MHAYSIIRFFFSLFFFKFRRGCIVQERPPTSSSYRELVIPLYEIMKHNLGFILTGFVAPNAFFMYCNMGLIFTLENTNIHSWNQIHCIEIVKNLTQLKHWSKRFRCILLLFAFRHEKSNIWLPFLSIYYNTNSMSTKLLNEVTYLKPNSLIACASQLSASDWFFGFFCSKAAAITCWLVYSSPHASVMQDKVSCTDAPFFTSPICRHKRFIM